MAQNRVYRAIYGQGGRGRRAGADGALVVFQVERATAERVLVRRALVHQQRLQEAAGVIADALGRQIRVLPAPALLRPALPSGPRRQRQLQFLGQQLKVLEGRAAGQVEALQEAPGLAKTELRTLTQLNNTVK